MARTLIAGIGNIFLSDDAFGVEVVRRLASEALGPHVEVRDFGIRALHLAYELTDGHYDTTIMVDAASRGGAPGALYLIEPSVENIDGTSPADAHAMNFEAVLALVKTLGGTAGRILIVGCEPQSIEEGMGLSEPVEAAVGEAVQMVRDAIAR